MKVGKREKRKKAARAAGRLADMLGLSDALSENHTVQELVKR